MYDVVIVSSGGGVQRAVCVIIKGRLAGLGSMYRWGESCMYYIEWLFRGPGRRLVTMDIPKFLTEGLEVG